MTSRMVALCAAGIVVLLGVAFRPAPSARRVGVPVRPARPQRAVLYLGAVAVCVVVALLGPLAATVGVVGAVFLQRWRALRTLGRRQRAIDAAYPDAIDLVVLAVRAGFLPAAGLAVATPHVPVAIRATFEEVSARVAAGERFADALGALDGLGPIARPLIDTFAAADRYGLALAPVLERLAFEGRQQRRRAADAAGRQLPVRLSLPLVLCTLPSFVLLAIVPLLLGAFSSLHLQ